MQPCRKQKVLKNRVNPRGSLRKKLVGRVFDGREEEFLFFTFSLGTTQICNAFRLKKGGDHSGGNSRGFSGACLQTYVQNTYKHNVVGISFSCSLNTFWLFEHSCFAVLYRLAFYFHLLYTFCSPHTPHTTPFLTLVSHGDNIAPVPTGVEFRGWSYVIGSDYIVSSPPFCCTMCNE